MTDPADFNVYYAETYGEYHGMADTCPFCGAEMVFIPAPSRAENAARCSNCDYWEERIVQDDGVLCCGHRLDRDETWTKDTVIAVGHVPEEGEG